MLQACNLDGEPIAAYQAESGESYYCPACHAELILKSGAHKITHFAHRNNPECAAHSEGETSEHLTGKLQLAQLLKVQGKTVIVEYYIEVLKQRPDLFVRHQQQNFVLEFQCAPLSVEKMKQRSEGYRRLGIAFLWILGERHRLQRGITQQIAQFIRWLPNLGFYLVYYSVKRKKLELYYHLEQADYLPVASLSFTTANFQELITFMKKPLRLVPQKLTSRQRSQQILKFQRDCFYSQGKIRELQQDWYQEGLVLQQLEFFFMQQSYSAPLYGVKQLYWKSKYLLAVYREKGKLAKLHQLGIRLQQQSSFSLPLVKLEHVWEEQLVDFNGILKKYHWFFRV
ncbi:competence protein CoiA family protein [Liquorilactobacillus satsumensis]|uniref:Competence protein transcription factor n=1 Tax=Liquorilactobacillus satsumensis DSM 16230 = JCM 12392 TaxID=1423801 RepID=A0A0R1V9M9_9LACO|nr:competence protein CoiA family protein [Liquorilactobacillus satsumensis]KRL99717.1 competence protein transcription factor [Liquorilactobacillus satsumensis DSM 16230 = JCM 12392]MCP9313471.1 competence protein [Liquorilactobacillus satsumensis]MCP9328266.1 competence protein [Liquorilactobacillus satsumensis]MCP9360604.1 competence protein [Liquorilactobacillus satsumensis]